MQNSKIAFLRTTLILTLSFQLVIIAIDDFPDSLKECFTRQLDILIDVLPFLGSDTVDC